jgi:hypothetical protein
MRRTALVPALSLALALLAPAARADDPPRDGREQALDRREQALNLRELRDDQRDLARIESLVARLDALRAGRPAPDAVAWFDADVQRELASERIEGRGELWRYSQEVRRGRDEVSSDQRRERERARAGDVRGVVEARRDQQDDRRNLSDDVRDRNVEAAQGERLETLRREWAALRGRYGPPALERRHALLAELVVLARQELMGDRRERREDRRELREDRREDRREERH